MPAASRDPATDSPCDRAFAALHAALAVVFVRGDDVIAACATLRERLAETASRVDDLRRLAATALSRTGAFVAPIVELVVDAACASTRPWGLLEPLLDSRVASACTRALETARHLARRGTLRVDADVLRSLAALIDREGSPLAVPPLLEEVGRLVTLLEGGDADAPDRLERLLLEGEPASVRRLAAKLLDIGGGAPSPSTISAALGETDAARLSPVLAYTRATHQDLESLVPSPGLRAPLAACMDAAETCCGPAVAADLTGELGWRRINLGSSVQPYVGVSVDDSIPLLLRPSEAALVEACAGAQRAFERVVAVGHGGSWQVTPAGASGADAIGRFRAYNLAHAEVLGDILDNAPLSVQRVHSLLARMDHITSEFAAIFAGRSDECVALPGFYADLEQRILDRVAAAAPDESLPMEVTRLVLMFEDPPSLAQVTTLHGLKRYLHQKGLALGFGLLEAGHGTNRSVDLALASPERVLTVARRIEYVDFDTADDAGPARAAIPYPVAIVADGFTRQLLLGQVALPKVRVFCYGNEVHYFVYFKNHPVFIRIDFSPPLGGGMIDLAYYGVSKFEIHAHPAIALEGIQAFFRRLDFFVEVDTTRIHARYDKERALDLADLCEKAEALFRLVPYLMDVDWIVGSLDLPEQARRAVGEAWADLFARWGVLPTHRLLTTDRTAVLLAREPRPEGELEVRWPGSGPYADAVSGRPRPELPSEIHAALATRGVHIPLVECEREGGQIALEKHLLAPLREALARGEVVDDAPGFRPAPPELFRRQHEADRFAELLAADRETLVRAIRLAQLANALERTLRFETTGSVNGYDVQRARLALRGAAVTIYALRDAGGIFRLAVYAPGDALVLRRSDAAGPWRDNVSLDVGALAALLRRNNFLPSWIDAVPERGAHEVQRVLAAFTTPRPAGRSRLAAGARAVTCAKAAPGRGVGVARLGIAGREPEDLEGGVLFAATLGPRDQAFLHHAVAVVGTGGGILSHAGLMAVQSGRPALMLAGTWRDTYGGQSSITYRRVEFDEQHRTVAGCQVVERCRRSEFEEDIREGDLVVVDADEGLLEVLGQATTTLALHDGLRGIDQAGRRLARIDAPTDVLVQRGRLLRAAHQVEKLVPRLRDAALVRYAVQALVAADHGGPPEVERERVRLLRLLLETPTSRAIAATCLEGAGDGLRDRMASECRQALTAIPSARSADEVVWLRANALRRRAQVDRFSALLAKSGLAPRGGRDGDATAIDLAVARRLAWMFEHVLGELREALARGPEAPRARLLLRQALRLADVTAPSGEAAAWLDACGRDLAERDQAVVGALAARRVIWPADGGLELEPLVGAKAANLAEVQRSGCAVQVPPWFVVSDRAFRDVLQAPAPPRPSSPWARGGVLSLREAIDAVLARTDADAKQKSVLIEQLWQDVAVPGPVGEDVLTAYRRVSDGEDAFVAIRSSAREEDTPGAVRAGEFDTFLFVRGEQALLAHLRRAWSGLWTARAIHDRSTSGRDGLGEGGGVLVQRIVWSRVSGVLQTINVAEGRTREMAIDVGLGLGEGVVSGLVTADHVVVSKDEDPDTRPLRFHYVSGDKRERVVFDERRGTGTVRADVLSHQRLRPALEYTELVELVRAATRLEAAYGYPLDIEFGLEGARLFVLQVRPVPGTQAVWRETIECRRSTGGDGARARQPDVPTSRPEPGREASP